MARPTKHNADYFSHDTAMRNDPKIKALRRKYSHIGYSVWNMILELLTSNEYFEYEWNELNIELLAPDFDIDSDDLESIVEYCIKIGLLQFTNGYLHCDKLTFRLEDTLLARRKDYCSNNARRYGVNVNNNSINDNINTQSKVKESKLNKSKAKQSKVKESIEEKTEDSSPVYVLDKNYKKGYTPEQLDKEFEEFNNIVNK